MNEFEIKTAKQGLRELGLIEIYNVSEEYNYEEYESIEVDVVLQYSYKREKYYAHCIFNKQVQREDKISKVKKAINSQINYIEHLLYEDKNPYLPVQMDNFINTQIDLYFASVEKPKPSKDFSDVSRSWERAKKGRSGNVSSFQVYKEALKLAKEDNNIYE